jgi:Ca-activated chloride channel family protein
MAYGTEKRTWLVWAAREFAGTPEGRQIDVKLIPLGSLEAAQRVWEGKDPSIDVWCPASAMYKDVFVTEWQAKYNTNPIAKEEPIALTPMVFVMWEDRYQPFVKKYNELTFRTIAQAMADDGGWGSIADQPDWGFFKFSHTHPNKSNSGLTTLLLMAHDYFGRPQGLGGTELTRPEFQKHLRTIENGAVMQMGQLVDSTGNLMVDMVRFGPSRYDAVFVYEATAIDQLRQAEGRWGRLRVVYPKYNFWNDNPYYVLDVPWSTPARRDAAGLFLAFLLSERVQAKAIEHGFRPANTSVPTTGPDSPWVKFQSHGLRADLPGQMCAPPRAEVIHGLLNRWQQIRQ